MENYSEWTDISCPNCKYYMVACDAVGYRCFICGWEKDHGGKEFFPKNKDGVEIDIKNI